MSSIAFSECNSKINLVTTMTFETTVAMAEDKMLLGKFMADKELMDRNAVGSWFSQSQQHCR